MANRDPLPSSTKPTPDDEDQNQDQQQEQDQALVDELGVEDLTEVIFGNRGRIFSAAGRESPVAEFVDDSLILHPPQKPFESEEAPTETIHYDVDEKGILLNELGQQRRIVGAKFNGHAIYTLGETKPGTTKHYAAWFDEAGVAHKFYVQGEALTVDMIFRIRNRTHDGEISIFGEIGSD